MKKKILKMVVVAILLGAFSVDVMASEDMVDNNYQKLGYVVSNVGVNNIYSSTRNSMTWSLKNILANNLDRLEAVYNDYGEYLFSLLSTKTLKQWKNSIKGIAIPAYQNVNKVKFVDAMEKYLALEKKGNKGTAIAKAKRRVVEISGHNIVDASAFYRNFCKAYDDDNDIWEDLLENILNDLEDEIEDRRENFQSDDLSVNINTDNHQVIPISNGGALKIFVFNITSNNGKSVIKEINFELNIKSVKSAYIEVDGHRYWGEIYENKVFFLGKFFGDNGKLTLAEGEHRIELFMYIDEEVNISIRDLSIEFTNDNVDDIDVDINSFIRVVKALPVITEVYVNTNSLDDIKSILYGSDDFSMSKEETAAMLVSTVYLPILLN